MANSNRSVRAEYWQGVLEQFWQSDLSAPVFCKEKGIPIVTPSGFSLRIDSAMSA